LLASDRGAQEIGHRHYPDQGAIVVQHGETADFALEQELPRISGRGLTSHRRHIGAHQVLDQQGHQQ
jgi:hypothetical protein